MADGRWHPLRDGFPPPWASEWGQDRFGVFVGFRVGDVQQRMRWIPAGTFLMGSPKGERGRFAHEGPQHQVTLTRGSWLGDTPVTQALWKAVTGENPSGFESPDHPVEQVSWDDCERFCKALTELVPGSGFRLPTEAEWEHACRAGTTAATYGGELEDEKRAPVLEPIAWYDGNSDGQTHPVKQKQPNAWGLYDMLGNVWEWCQDGMRDYSSDALQDPKGPMRTGGFRVNRGGSWLDLARCVRAAYRNGRHPSYRVDDLGVRLARDQAPPEAANQ